MRGGPSCLSHCRVRRGALRGGPRPPPDNCMCLAACEAHTRGARVSFTPAWRSLLGREAGHRTIQNPSAHRTPPQTPHVSAVSINTQHQGWGAAAAGPRPQPQRPWRALLPSIDAWPPLTLLESIPYTAPSCRPVGAHAKRGACLPFTPILHTHLYTTHTYIHPSIQYNPALCRCPFGCRLNLPHCRRSRRTASPHTSRLRVSPTLPASLCHPPPPIPACLWRKPPCQPHTRQPQLALSCPSGFRV